MHDCNSQKLSLGDIFKLWTSNLSIRPHQVSDGLAYLPPAPDSYLSASS